MVTVWVCRRAGSAQHAVQARRGIERAAVVDVELARFAGLVRRGVHRADQAVGQRPAGGQGIGHRLKAYGELLAEHRLDVEDVTLVQVASPSRERPIRKPTTNTRTAKASNCQ